MRLSSERGETLTETLAAILVCVLATAALMTATTVASKLNMQANEHERDLLVQQDAAELRENYLEKDESGSYVEKSDGENQQVEIAGKGYTVALSGGSDVVSYDVLMSEGV